MDILCRLCGERMLSHQVKCTINDRKQDIERKLIDCCRWDLYENDQNLPESICISCFICLEQSWKFCESVSNTQSRLREIFGKTKLQKSENSDIETNVENEKYFDDHESFDDFETNVWSAGEVDDENQSQIKFEPLTVFEIDDETELNDRTVESMVDPVDMQPTVSVERPIVATVDNHKRRTRAKNREHKKEAKYNDENTPNDLPFPDCIEPHERCPDGTIAPQAIARLKLCDWTIYQPQCHVCNVCCMNLYELRKHYKKQHPHVPMRYKCWLCTEGRDFSKRQILIRHVINHHCPYLANCCKHCNVFYWDASVLKVHQLRRKCNDKSHKLLPVICEHCGDVFGNEYNYRSHLNFKHMSHISPHLRNVFECFLCKIVFDKRSKCKEHMKKHVGRNLAKCAVCQLTVTKKYLRQHYRTHLDFKPFTCSFCGKGFKFNSKLKNHERIHTGSRPYKCKSEGCDYCTGDGGNIYKHMRLKHNMVFPKK